MYTFLFREDIFGKDEHQWAANGGYLYLSEMYFIFIFAKYDFLILFQ